MNKRVLKAKITKAMRRGISAKAHSLSKLIPESFTTGKIYEAYILGLVCEKLHVHEKLKLKLIGGNKIALKSSPGPINTNYPHIAVFNGQMQQIATIWTDIEFTVLNAQSSNQKLNSGDYHEMDIAVVKPNAVTRPTPDQVLLLVECKNTSYLKSFFREIIGIRSELSNKCSSMMPTAFSVWPRKSVPSDPPACITVYSTDPNVTNYSNRGHSFGIDFFHEPL